MQTYTQTFAGAQTWQLNVPGRYFVILTCTNTLNIRFYLGGKKLDMGDITGLLAGLEVGPLDPAQGFTFAFDRIEIDVTGADTVQVGIGNGAARYNRANATVTVANNKQPQTAAFGTLQATVTNASTQILAANTVRQWLFIQNNDPTGIIYINFGSPATVAGSIKILPGQSFEMAGTQTTTSILAIGSLASQNNVIVAQG